MTRGQYITPSQCVCSGYVLQMSSLNVYCATELPTFSFSLKNTQQITKTRSVRDRTDKVAVDKVEVEEREEEEAQQACFTSCVAP